MKEYLINLIYENCLVSRLKGTLARAIILAKHTHVKICIIRGKYGNRILVLLFKCKLQVHPGKDK